MKHPNKFQSIFISLHLERDSGVLELFEVIL